MHASAAPGQDRARASARWQRLAAIVALLAAVALAALLARYLGVVLIVLALVLLGSACTWYALTTTGSRRAIGGVLAALAAGGMVTLMAVHGRGTLVLIATLGLLALFGVSARYALGRSVSWCASEFEVRSHRPVAVGLDGEALVLGASLRFASLPGALRVRLPSSVGMAPAARAIALTAGKLSALWRVAAGR